MDVKGAIEFVENICESLNKQCDSGSGSDDVDTVMMGIEANKVIKLLKRGEKYEKMWEELDAFIMLATRAYSVVNEMGKIKRKYFPKGD